MFSEDLSSRRLLWNVPRLRSEHTPDHSGKGNKTDCQRLLPPSFANETRVIGIYFKMEFLIDGQIFSTLPIERQMVAGGLAGLCQIVITTPMELLKIQMQDAGRVAAQLKSGKDQKKMTIVSYKKCNLNNPKGTVEGLIRLTRHILN